MRIVIVDDEEIIGEMLQMMTQSVYPNAEIILHTNPNEAIDYLDNNQIDFVLTDYNLGSSLTGLDIISHLGKRATPPPACIVSGYMPDMKGLEYRNTLFALRKPFGLDDIKNLLSQIEAN